MSTYLFDNAAIEASDRFTSLERCYDKVTISRLVALGVAEGWRCLEVGGGGGSIARWLSGQVGTAGSVLATDINPDKMYGDAGNLEIRHHDIVTDELPEAHFDLAHARLVLLHIPERKQALKRILRSLKPGGWLLLDEFDLTWRMPVLAAPSPDSVVLVDKVLDGIHRLLEQAGLLRTWARDAYSAMRQAGFTDLDYTGFCEVWSGGSVGANLHRANALQVAPQLVSEDLVTEDELGEFLTLLEDPDVAFSSYLMLSTWGRRPD